jgi:hypothetical protein
MVVICAVVIQIEHCVILTLCSRGRLASARPLLGMFRLVARTRTSEGSWVLKVEELAPHCVPVM